MLVEKNYQKKSTEGLGQGPVAGFCERGNEPSTPLKEEEFPN
jgi:hypothetical protein